MLEAWLGRTNPYIASLETKVQGIQQGTSVWVNSPKFGCQKKKEEKKLEKSALG
jgi:hypothetical protein